MNIGDQLDLAAGAAAEEAWKTAWRHEARGPDGEWIRGAGTVGKLAEQAADAFKPKKAKQWEFIGPHGSLAGQAFLPGNREPELGDMARDGQGGVGRVISKGGGHVVLDADDGNRYLVDWRNGGSVVRQVPIGDAPWQDPRADPVKAAMEKAHFEAEALKQGVKPGPLAGVAEHFQQINEDIARQEDEAAKRATPRGTNPGGTAIGKSADFQHLRSLIPAVRNAVRHPESADVYYPTQGAMGDTAIYRLPSGEEVIYKRQEAEDWAGDPGIYNDAEALSSLVAHAIGAPMPAIIKTDQTHLLEQKAPGVTFSRYSNQVYEGSGKYADVTAAKERLYHSHRGQLIGYLDYMTGNKDRNDGNWMVDENEEPTGIDMGLAEFDGDGSYSDFWHHESDTGSHFAELPRKEVQAWGPKLESLRPAFDRMGRSDWYVNLMDSYQRLLDGTVDRGYSISGQAGIELGWRFNSLEARNAHGEWSRIGSGYAVPDPARLHNDRSPYKDPGDHPFFKQHPVSAANVTKVYDATTPAERAQGMRWYADAHTLATAIGKGNTQLGASMLAAYSPQTSWPVNMFNAAHAIELGRALGPGDGMITGDMQGNAQEALDGHSIDDNFGDGAPKINAFAHLIADGGDSPDDQLGQVVIDRHAMTIAMGTRLAKKDADKAPIGKQRFYEHVADTYRQAADDIRRRDGIAITPHQLQAITWLHQQTANQLEDEHNAAQERLARGRQTSLKNAWEKWNQLATAEHLPVEHGTTALTSAGWQQLWELSISGQYDLAFNPLEPRDTRGRWTRFGGVAQAAETAEKNREGFSVSVVSGSEPPGGYMVAQTGHTHTYPESILDDHAKLTRAIDDMLMTEKPAFAGKQTYLGGWVHDGKLWLEPSDRFDSQEQAVAEGSRRNQIAIFDLNTFNEIQTGGSGGGRITEHDASGRPVRTYDEGGGGGAAGLSQPSGERAPGYSSGHRHQDPVGIGAQLDLAHDAYLHEHRGPHGEWIKDSDYLGGWVLNRMTAAKGDPVPGHPELGTGTVLGKAGNNQVKVSFPDKGVIRTVDLQDDYSNPVDEPLGMLIKRNPAVPDLGLDRFTPEDDYSGDENAAIYDYMTQDGSHTINSALRHNRLPPVPHPPASIADDWWERENWEEAHPNRRAEIPILDKMIARYSTSKPATIYRGFSMSDETAAKLKPGSTFTDKGYVSTSSSLTWANRFAQLRSTGHAENTLDIGVKALGGKPTIMKIHVPAGQHMVPGETDIGEFVLPRGSKYRVDDIEPDGTMNVTVVS